MSQTPIQLVTGGDLRFLPGIQVTLASALIGIPGSREVILHILDGGLGVKGQEKLQSLTRRCHMNAKAIFHVVPEASLKTFMPGPGNSRMYYARIGMASLITDAERVIYLDSDTLVLGDLTKLWETDSAGTIVMACRDRKVSKISEDSPWHLTPEEVNLPYFNSGVMLVDLRQWRTEGIEQQCLNLIAKPAGTYRWWDQTILNHLLRGRVGFLSQEWNWQSEQVSDLEKNPKIIHYTTGIKPWGYWGSDFRFKAWRSCYKAYIGLPLLLFLQKSAWNGLLTGLFDGLIENSKLVREIYLRYLKLSLRFSRKPDDRNLLRQKIRFLEAPRKLRNRSLENRILKEFRQRLTIRIAPHQA